MTLRRLIVVILVAWVLLFVVGYVVFASGGNEPGDGRGDTIEQPASP